MAATAEAIAQATRPDLQAFARTKDLPQLYELLDRVQMKNGWAKPTPSLYPEPRQRYVPAHWRYAEARAALDAAGRLVDTEWAERRNLILANPIPGNDYPTVTTLVAAYQMVKGGEKARSHRHTPNAMRVVVEVGRDCFTVVEGQRVPMSRGDVLLTPNWMYHGHANDGPDDAYWIDILDAPTVQLLGPMFFEHHPDVNEAAPNIAASSPMRFAYADYAPRLAAQPEVAPGVRAMELGPPTLDTFDRTALSLGKRAAWKPPRSTASRILVVVEGEGRSTIGDRTFAWGAGDVLAVPAWLAHRHEATSRSLVIAMSDEPLLRKLSWFRAEAA